MTHPSFLRRATAVVVAAAFAMAACSGEDDASSDTSSTTEAAAPTEATEDAPSTRTVETERGAVEIPAEPQRIVALDEYAAMHMLAVGIEPAVVRGAFQAEISQEVLTGAGIEVVDASIGTGLSVEDVADEQPDLIVLTDEPALTEHYDDLAQFAPTVVLPFDLPWREAIENTATVFDRQEEGDRLVAALEGRIEEVADGVPTDGPTISVLGNIFDMLFAVSPEAPLSALIEEVGLGRPEAEANGEPFEAYPAVMAVSPEELAEHDADLVAVFAGIDYNADAVTSLPTFQDLPAVVDGHAHEVDGGMWFGTFPFAVFWVLEDLAALTGDPAAEPGTIDDTADRAAAFGELVR